MPTVGKEKFDDMPNAKEHLVAGLVVGAVVNGAIQWLDRIDDPNKPFDWSEFFLCSFAGGAAALLPDLLEPADSPRHRKFFHSLTAAALVAHGISGKHTENFSGPACQLLAVLGIGYLSHIALDCTTPAAIDLISQPSHKGENLTGFLQFSKEFCRSFQNPIYTF